MSGAINTRKKEHIEICLRRNVSFDRLTNGFENFRLIHNALPEIDLNEVNLETEFLGKKINAPIMISSMTGGTPISKKINQNLAKAAQELKIPLAVGSQRVALEQPELKDSFDVRAIAQDIPIIANLGAVQLNYGIGIDECERAVEMIDADALILHLNPLQEALQGGDTNFKDLIPKIRGIVKGLSVPVIVKEVGFGISLDAAKRIEKSGVKIIDVAGAGGTNFSKVESIIANNKSGSAFSDWGLPTSNLIKAIHEHTRLKIIAGGGIRTGVDIAKAICLGAELASIGLPLLKPATQSSEQVKSHLNQIINELRIAMFSLGAKNISELKKAKIVKVS